MKDKSVIAILDADIFCYKVAAASTKEIEFEEYVHSFADISEAKVALDNWFVSVQKKLNARLLVLAFTTKNNYRKKLDPNYKSNRTKPPYLFKLLVDYCRDKYVTAEQEGFEADDILGMKMSESYLGLSADIIGVSEDKDLLSVPGKLYNPGHETFTDTTLLIAIYRFYMQTLVGDTTDNYKGCPGVGTVKANKILEAVLEKNPHTLTFIHTGWEAVLKTFKDDKLAYLNASMAKILWYGEPGGEFHPNSLVQFYQKDKK